MTKLAIPGPQTAIGRLIRLPLRLVSRDRPLRIVSGPLRGWRWLPASGVHSYWLGWFESDEVALLTSLIHRGDVVFDVGAHVGYYTLLASRLVGDSGRVLAFEPLPRNLEYLRRHVALNACANVRVMAAAVADVAGRAAFQDGAMHAEGALATTGAREVDVVTLDAMAYGAPDAVPPALLKIDVEGAEVRVLTGAERVLAEAKPTILLSTHGRESYRECQVVLARYGYRVRPMSETGKGTELVATVDGK